MTRYEFLRDNTFDSLHLTRNDDLSANYTTAAEWIDNFDPGAFTNVPADEIAKMKETNTIWRLQIYPHTPIGFYVFYGATMDYVIDQAMSMGA